MDYMQEYQKWLDSGVLTGEEAAELEAIRNDPKEIESRFYGPLEFGTAGLRGTMKMGLHQMNVYVIRHATQGFANVICAEGEEAKRKGAIAMFGEKYGDIVRVVEMGDFSMKFCGGTHLDNTAKAGPFRIKSEGSIASGVRRIEATVGQLSLDTMNKNQELLFHAAQVLKPSPGELAAKAEQQMADMKELRHALEKFKSEASLNEARQFRTAAKEVGGLKVLTAHRDGMDANALRQMGDFLRDKEPAAVAVLSSVGMSGVPGGGYIGEFIMCSVFFPEQLAIAYPIAITIGNLVDPPATMINSSGDYVVSFVVSRFVDGKDLFQKVLASRNS